MKNPRKLAEDFFAHNDYNEFSADEVFVIGYKAAHNKAVQVINEELKRVQSLLPDPEFQAAEYILKFILKEMDKD